MTKRIFAILLCTLLLFPFGACQKVAPTAPDELESLRKSTAGEYAYFAAKGSNTALRLKMPTEWEFEGEDSAYVIKDGEATVGSVVLGTIANHADVMTEAKREVMGGVTVTTYTGVYKKDGEKTAWYRMVYEYTDDEGEIRTATFEIKSDEMDSVAFKWLSSPTPLPIKDYHKLPSLSLNAGNGKKSIAILGNSFVYNQYSGIRPILNDMLSEGNKTCDLTVKGIGYASVSAYATNTDSDYRTYIDNIKNSNYGIVFMCGIYSEADVTALETIYDACQSSNTQLVIFPAHNENETHIASAIEKYPQLTCLNWKSRINAYIDTGLDKSDFCVDDAHSHSNALAGYIGAQMIYQSLFGEAPPELSSNCSVIKQSAVDEKLSGRTIAPDVLISEKDIYFLR